MKATTYVARQRPGGPRDSRLAVRSARPARASHSINAFQWHSIRRRRTALPERPMAFGAAAWAAWRAAQLLETSRAGAADLEHPRQPLSARQRANIDYFSLAVCAPLHQQQQRRRQRQQQQQLQPLPPLPLLQSGRFRTEFRRLIGVDIPTERAGAPNQRAVSALERERENASERGRNIRCQAGRLAHGHRRRGSNSYFSPARRAGRRCAGAPHLAGGPSY